MGRLTNLNPPAPIAEGDIPGGIARDAEVTAVMNTHLAATDPHPQYLLPSEADSRYRLISTPLTDGDIPSGVARDTEVAAVMNAHLAATDPHQQYLKGLSMRVTVNPPPMAAGALEKFFYTMNGANIGDLSMVAPVAVNLYANAGWPFLFFSVVEAANTVALYIRNDGVAQDLGSFDIRILVVKF